MAKTPEPDRSLFRICGGLAVAIGAVGLVGYALGFFFRGEVPLVLAYAHVGACVIEVSIAYALFRQRRAAWAYAIALEGTMTLVNLLGLSFTLRAGAIGAASAGVVLARMVLFLLLIVDAKEYR